MRENHRARGEAKREESKEASLTFQARGGVHELPRISHSLRISIFKQGHSVLSGGGVSLRKSVVQSAWQYDVTSRVSDFQNGEQSVHRRDG